MGGGNSAVAWNKLRGNCVWLPAQTPPTPLLHSCCRLNPTRRCCLCLPTSAVIRDFFEHIIRMQCSRQQAATTCTNGILSSTDSRVYGATRGGQGQLWAHIKFHFAAPSWNRARLMKVKQLLMSAPLTPFPTLCCLTVAILQTIKCFAWQYAICFDMDILCWEGETCSVDAAKTFLIICEKVIKTCTVCVCVSATVRVMRWLRMVMITHTHPHTHTHTNRLTWASICWA